MTSNQKSIAKLPLWDELPGFSLHLDQLLDITNSYVEPIIGETVTKTMIHNYFKGQILDSPETKGYERKQLAGAIVVDLLKNVFTLSEIKQGLNWILVDASPQEGYDNFARMFNEQAAQKRIGSTKVTSIDLKSASKATVMQYHAVQAILFWLSTRRILKDNLSPGNQSH
ncbi:MAG: DUF1836 domain-containing protein [Lentilactobacillus diolivorans]|uniref:DUF1836 domain-containing protein n=1 Tax=Lentilactobacillus diolivorans TaxID=179838 RepID=UPI0039EB0919